MTQMIVTRSVNGIEIKDPKDLQKYVISNDVLNKIFDNRKIA